MTEEGPTHTEEQQPKLFLIEKDPELVVKMAQGLRDLRAKAHLTQRSAAMGIGVTETAYRHYESRRAQPSIDKLPALARVYGVSLYELFFTIGLLSDWAGGTEDTSLRHIRDLVLESSDLAPEAKSAIVNIIILSQRVKEPQSPQ